jgi:hypothetical protein
VNGDRCTDARYSVKYAVISVWDLKASGHSHPLLSANTAKSYTRQLLGSKGVSQPRRADGLPDVKLYYSRLACIYNGWPYAEEGVIIKA